MTVSFIEAPGELIKEDELEISKTKNIVQALKRLPYYKFIETRRIEHSGVEVLVFDLDVEVSQRKKNDIHNTERIAALFFPDDLFAPEVLTLRDDFPIVPHLNLRPFDKPRSICLFDEPYNELKLRWTPTFFLERIRNWLSLTADGELHPGDQPLEPLLYQVNENLVIPSDLFQPREEPSDILVIRYAQTVDEKITYIAEYEKQVLHSNKKDLQFMAISLQGEPQTHGIMLRQPQSLFELHTLLLNAKLDLLDILQRKFMAFEEHKQDLRLILIIHLPKTRTDSGIVEKTDIYAFATVNDIKKIGVDIGIWSLINGKTGALIARDQSKNGENVAVSTMNPIPAFSRELAWQLSGSGSEYSKNCVLVGVGALGSQLFLNLTRMGFGEWTLIDGDQLLPHNLARHALPGFFVGSPKAQAMTDFANSLMSYKPIAKSLVINVLNPKDQSDTLNQIYESSELIIDASASVAVARHLSRDIRSAARRVSVFFNPLGIDGVVLVEDRMRKTQLDCLEMQYYRSLIEQEELRYHLKIPEGAIRYARSCGDISTTIPQDFVALHASLCAKALRNAVAQDNAQIYIWRIDGNKLTVRSFEGSVYKTIEHKIGSWTVLTDEYILGTIFSARRSKIPNETGGVLIGTHDMQRKIIYIGSMIPSPQDSEEWPTIYIRGCKGLKETVEKVQELTLYRLNYVGEWHSHPSHNGTSLSDTDKRALTQLAAEMAYEGLPGLMLIVGDEPEYSFHLWYDE